MEVTFNPGPKHSQTGQASPAPHQWRLRGLTSGQTHSDTSPNLHTLIPSTNSAELERFRDSGHKQHPPGSLPRKQTNQLYLKGGASFQKTFGLCFLEVSLCLLKQVAQRKAKATVCSQRLWAHCTRWCKNPNGLSAQRRLLL